LVFSVGCVVLLAPKMYQTYLTLLGGDWYLIGMYFTTAIVAIIWGWYARRD
jgi:hypothetical protein